jgi:hypothetical protein
LVALSEADMQHMLNKLHDWCKRWGNNIWIVSNYAVEYKYMIFARTIFEKAILFFR